MLSEVPKRILFAVNAFAGDELRAGGKDIAKIFSVFTNESIGTCDDGDSKMINDCRTPGNLSNELEEFLQEWDSKNQLIFFYSGHGIKRKGKYYLKFGPKNSERLLNFENVINTLEANNVEKAIIIVDACFSGAITKGIESDIFQEKKDIQIPEGYLIISSSSSSELSHEMRNGGASLFTKIFTECLSSGAGGKKSKDSLIRFSDLKDYFKEQMKKTPYSEYSQTPYYSVTNGSNEEIWIAKNISGELLENNPSLEDPRIYSSIISSEIVNRQYEKISPLKYPCYEAKIQDLDKQLLSKYAEYALGNNSIAESFNIDEENTLREFDFFSPIKYESGKEFLHKSAVLCFHKNPEKFFQNCRSSLVIFSEEKKIIYGHNFIGPLPKQIEEIRKSIHKELGVTFFNNDGDGVNLLNTEWKELIRELISNAFAHRDYNDESPIKVNLFPQYLEILNPGYFHESLKWDQILNSDSYLTKPKNKLIDNYLKSVLAYEGWGRGFSVIKNFKRKYGEDSVLFKELPGNYTSVKVKIQRNNMVQVTAKNANIGNVYAEGNIRLGEISYSHIEKEVIKEMTTIPTRNPNSLIGRTAFLLELRKELEENKEIVLVNAMGGVGKTSVAEAYSAQYYHAYQRMVWIKQNENEDIRLAFTNNEFLIRSLNIQTEGKKIEDLFEEVCHQLRQLKEQPKLLVLDNVDQSIMAYMQLLPKPPNWHVLFTSREGLPGLKQLKLDFLPDEDALAVFKKYYERPLKKEEEAKALDIINLIDRHTLTIEILAKAKRKNRYNWTQLKAALQKDIKVGAETAHSTQQKVKKVKTYLSRIFDMSQLPEAEIWLLKQFACLPSDAHTFDLLYDLLQSEGLDEQLLSELCTELHEKGWLLYNDKEESFKLHAIIAELIPEKYPVQEEDVGILLDALSGKLKIDYSKDNPIDKFPWAPFGLAFLEQVDDGSPKLAALQNNLALVLQDLGDYEGAKGLLEKAIISDERNFGKDHPETANKYSNLAIVLKDLGDYEGAKALLEKAVKSAERNFGKDHPETANKYSNLAIVLKDLGDYEGAKGLLEKAVKSDERNFGKDHPTTALSYSNLAMVLKDLGDYEGAKGLLEKAVKSDERNFGKDHPTTALSYSNLAIVLKDLGDYEGAKGLLEKAVKSDERNFGKDHPSTARSYSNLALVLKDLGDYEGAKGLLEKAIISDERNFGKDHPSTAVSYSNLATVLQDLGDYEGAKALLEKAIISDERNFGKDHPETAKKYSNSALVLQDLGDYEGAKSLLEKAIISDERNIGKDHPETAKKYSNLASVLKDLGDYEGAKSLLEKAVLSDERNFGKDHPSTAVSYSNLALVLQDLGDYEGAKGLLEKAVKSAERNFGKDHPTTALRYWNFASVLYYLRDFSTAYSYVQQAQAIFHKTLPAEHPYHQRVQGWKEAIEEKLQ